ncbi:hypothetical protein [Streptomyces sp. NPDC029004]|uniref:hypothetical protein n=1 Tax=Streptomyces sp. NPDC029004 TaxID=3154490 RepID=UPI00340C2F26
MNNERDHQRPYSSHPDSDGTYPAKLIFRGEGLTMVLKPGGEWQTLLEAGAGMDLRIRML